MPNLTEEDLQLFNRLPAAIDIQAGLLKKWCKENNWTNLQLNSELQFCAIAPSSFIPVPLPKEALIELEKHQPFFDLLRKFQLLRQRSRSAASVALSSVIAYGGTVLFKNTVTFANTPPNFSMLMNISNACLILTFVAFTLVASLSSWQYYSLKKQLNNLTSSNFLVNLTNIEHNSLMKILRSSRSFRD